MSSTRPTTRALRLVTVAVALATAGCATREIRTLTRPERLELRGGEARFHLRDGGLARFTRWRLDGDHVSGDGLLYDTDRKVRDRGEIRILTADVVIVETSRMERYGSAPFIALGVVTAVGTVACATNPKACFGSCPTFYVPHAGAPDGWALQAEGFSTSVSPALEADDLDDLPLAHPVGGAVELAMRNEALETHVLRRLELLVVDAPAGAAPLQLAAGGFVGRGPAVAAERCDAGTEACARLAVADGDELVLASDGVDLAATDVIELGFPPPGARRAAIELTARNTLMTTFVLYQLYAYFGSHVGELLASIERGDLGTLASLARWGLALDGVRVEVRQAGEPWRAAGRLAYIGPIATQTRGLVVDVAHPDRPLEVRLTLARADWRLDAIGLAPVVAEGLRPIAVPAEVVGGAADRARATAALAGDGARLVTLPGDELRLRFAVPPAAGGGRGYFLRARGYYLEWMRDAWLAEEDVARGWRLFRDPRAALEELAPAYRRVEAEMDAVFEASKFRRPAGTP